MGNEFKEVSWSEGETSSGDTLAAKPSFFSEGERVLAYHGPCVYEAKVQKVELRKKEWKYLVHYLGWNKSWDEWVGVDRLMKHTEKNIMKEQSFHKKPAIDKSLKIDHPSQTRPRVSVAIKGRKRNSDSSHQNCLSVKNLVDIPIPLPLKTQLVADWEFVNQQDKFVKLPRSPNVDDILAKYREYTSKQCGMMTDSVSEMLKGIRCYFDKGLSSMLLYKSERQQYDAFISSDVSSSTVYGAEHLLRLFVKLPELLACSNIEDEMLNGLHQMLLDFLKFLQKNRTSFFLADYVGSKVSHV